MRRRSVCASCASCDVRQSARACTCLLAALAERFEQLARARSSRGRSRRARPASAPRGFVIVGLLAQEDDRREARTRPAKSRSQSMPRPPGHWHARAARHRNPARGIPARGLRCSDGTRHDELRVGPAAREVVPDERAVARIVFDHQQPHGGGLEHARGTRVTGLPAARPPRLELQADDEVADVRARGPGMDQVARRPQGPRRNPRPAGISGRPARRARRASRFRHRPARRHPRWRHRCRPCRRRAGADCRGLR